MIDLEKAKSYEGKFVKVKEDCSMYRTYNAYIRGLCDFCDLKKNELYFISKCFYKTTHEQRYNNIQIEVVDTDMKSSFNGCNIKWLKRIFKIID